MAFINATYYLTNLGHEAINPQALEHRHGGTWKEFMRVDLKALVDCDAIYLLKGWHISKGARLERYIAYLLDIKVFGEEGTG